LKYRKAHGRQAKKLWTSGRNPTSKGGADILHLAQLLHAGGVMSSTVEWIDSWSFVAESIHVTGLLP